MLEQRFRYTAPSMAHSSRVAFVTILILAIAAAVTASRDVGPTAGGFASSAEMAAAARRFLGQLTPERRGKAALSLEGKERADWHVVPRDRPGLSFGEMTDADRVAARELLRTGLSGKGVLKIEAIMTLENVLRDLERGNPIRDPNTYAVTVFGSPDDADGAWGWRLEGHHLCLNFTCVKGEVVSVTPSFMGSNPGEIRSGLKAGERVLAGEEDLGRALVKSLTAAQRAKAVIDERAPAEVLTWPGRPMDEIWVDPPLGLAASEMSAQQRALLDELVEEYAHNLRGDLADVELARMREVGLGTRMDAVRFCWAGGVEKGQPHYYRIVGPSFVIEYDNTQNDANHVHTVWHDRTRDLGGDALSEHLKKDHGQGQGHEHGDDR